jgi:hypothetical protein
MGFFGWLIAALGFFYLVGRFTRDKGTKNKTSGRKRSAPAPAGLPNPETTPYDDVLAAHKSILTSRWEAMDKQAAGSEDLGFESWRYDPVTAAQLKKLEGLGVGKRARKKLSKGQASDMIGIAYLADPYERDLLKFFGELERNLSETAAREKVRVLMLDPSNVEKWASRPPTPFQKAFAKLYAIKLPPKATINDASETIAHFVDERYSEEDGENPIEDAFSAIDDAFDDLTNSKVCHEDYEIKKPSQKAIVEAIQAIGLSHFESGEADTQTIVEQLLEANPELERPYDD